MVLFQHSQCFERGNYQVEYCELVQKILSFLIWNETFNFFNGEVLKKEGGMGQGWSESCL
jgi:hypothetical protein